MSARRDGSGVLVRVSTEAPFRQIVGQIRAQIDGGQLRPGDRIPSARQITAEWGVAIATATKVLATLRAEGLVEAVRGVGTVVADRAEPAEPARRERRPRPAAAEPTREQLVRHALALADAEGLEAVSMRRLATEFGLATMSLYRFVRGKDDLVRLMIDAAFAEAPLPAVPPRVCTRSSSWSTASCGASSAAITGSLPRCRSPGRSSRRTASGTPSSRSPPWPRSACP
ncbi:GntR family transcriptional regulator [Catellatospora coxensis]